MARLRNRILKAEFWTDAELLRWPREKRWTYQGLWESAEDSGCLEDDPFGWKLQLWPSPMDSDITVELLTQWRDEMVEAGKLVPYEADGKHYLYCARFHQHEHPRNPQRPDLPLPPWVQWVTTEDEKGRKRNSYMVSIPTVTVPGQYCAANVTPAPIRSVPSRPDPIPKEEAAVVAHAREDRGGGIQEEHQEDDPLLWDLWEVPGWPRDDALDRKELAGAKRDYPRANLSEVIGDLRAEAPLKHPRKALRAFAKQAHERAPAERPTPLVLPTVPELTPEQRKAQVLAAAKARRQVEAMAAGIRGVT